MEDYNANYDTMTKKEMEENYNDYDRFLNSSFVYLHSIVKDNSVVLYHFNPESKYHLTTFEIASMYSNMMNKTLYLNTDLFTYIKFKRKYKNNFKWKPIMKNDKGKVIPLDFCHEVSYNEKLPLDIATYIYDAYYKIG